MCKRFGVFLLLFGVSAASRVEAEMGKGVALEGLYVSFDAAFVSVQGSSVRAYGVEESQPSFRIKDQYLDVNNGWSPGASIGYANKGGVLGIFSRAEITIDYSELNNDLSDQRAYSFLSAVDARDFAFYADHATSYIEATAITGSLPLKRDLSIGDEHTLTVGFEPFARWTQQELRTLLKSSGATASDPVNTYATAADLDQLYYGAMVTAEPELQLTDLMSIACRLGGGVYAHTARGRFRSEFQFPGEDETSNAQTEEHATNMGWRASLGAALKFRLAPSSLLTSYVTADYWSGGGSVELPTNDFYAFETQPASVDTTDSWDLRAGMRLTVGIPE